MPGRTVGCLPRAPRGSDRAPAGGDQGIERRRQDARDLRSGAARGSTLFRAAAGGCGHPGRGDRVRRHADEEALFDDGQREGGGVRANASLLGRTQERRPRSSPPPGRDGTRAAAWRPGSPRSPRVRAGGPDRGSGKSTDCGLSDPRSPARVNAGEDAPAVSRSAKVTGQAIAALCPGRGFEAGRAESRSAWRRVSALPSRIR